MRKLAAALSAILLLAVCATSTASAHSQHYDVAKVHYYHADGIVKWIGNHARITQYNPNHRIKNHWQAAVHYWRTQRHRAWLVLHPPVYRPTLPSYLVSAFTCIHRYEGSWTANTGNGYYGGLQMDYRFQSTYGGEFVRRWGTADNWPAWAQYVAAIRAYQSGRGFTPWPNTAHACGLL